MVARRRKKATTWRNNITIFLILLLLGLVWFLFFYKYSVIKILRTNFLINQKVERIDKLAQEREVLEEEKKKLEEQDPKTIEKKARELGLAKEGETIIRIKKANEDEKDN
jgi:cell division protein FtsB